MLIDLDARAEEIEELELRQRPIVEDLRPASASSPSALNGARGALLIAGLLLAVVGLAYLWGVAGRDARPPGSTTDTPNSAPNNSIAELSPAHPSVAAVTRTDRSIAGEAVADHGFQTDTTTDSVTDKASGADRVARHPAANLETAPHNVTRHIQPRGAGTPVTKVGPPPVTGSFSRTTRQSTPAQEAERAFQSAISLRQSGNIAEAEHELRNALHHNPKHSGAREALADLYVEQGHWNDAKQVLYEGITIDPGHFQYTLWLARLHIDLGEEAKAIAILESGVENAAGDPDYHATLATLYQRAGRFADAVTQYRNALAQQPRNGRWWLGLGIAFEKQERWPGARDAYLRAIGSAMLDERLAAYAEKRLDEVTRRITPAAKSGTP